MYCIIDHDYPTRFHAISYGIASYKMANFAIGMEIFVNIQFQNFGNLQFISLLRAISDNYEHVFKSSGFLEQFLNSTSRF